MSSVDEAPRNGLIITAKILLRRYEEIKTETIEFFATAPKGIPPLLVEELKTFGARGVKETLAGASFRGDLETAYRACLWSRLANRILMPIAGITARDPDELYMGVKSIPWEDHLVPDGSLSVGFTSTRSKITHTHYGALKVKDAIVDRFSEKYGRRPSVDTDDPGIRFNVHISRDHCTISLDSSGTSLHFRGYKIALGNAPVSEVLAAGLIKLSGWDKKKTFIDPMCGSGTILIEAAMLANDIPAGYYRQAYGFEKWKDFNQSLWNSIKERFKPPAVFPFKGIVGGDMSPLAMRATRKNIGNAGLQKLISLHPTSFETLRRPAGELHLVMNPPYGERIKSDDLIALYKGIGDTLKQNFGDAEAWIISGDLNAIKFVGLKTSKKIKIFNGPIECRFMKYELYEGSRKEKSSTNHENPTS